MQTDVLPLSSRPSRVPRSVRSRTAARHQLQMSSSGLTDQGRVRRTNEDRFLIRAFSDDAGVEQGHLFAVADGVGGSRAGGTASTLVIESVDQTSLQGLGLFRADADSVASALRDVFYRADRTLAEEVERRPALKGMATTLTAALCLEQRLFVGHVGDSRCYLLREGTLRQLTTDHTLPADLVRMGLIPPEAVATHPHRNILTDFIGGDDAPRVEVREHELYPGDALLVCSDGLTEMVSENAIRAILVAVSDPTDACERLVSLANEMGGRDNVTAIVARCAFAP